MSFRSKKPNNKKPNFKKSNFKKSNFKRKPYKKNFTKQGKKFTVKFSNLPSDLDRYELKDLLYEWGPIGRTCVNKYYSNTVAYVDFIKKHQAVKAVYQLNKTPFDGLIIEVEHVKSKY